jgi:hypothetical protein
MEHDIVMQRSEMNSILERTQQSAGSMIHTFEVQDREVDKKDPWSGILAQQ